MASGKDIRRRIKSVNNTKKITRAMEMVSAAKMRRAVASVVGIRPYAVSAWQILTNLARAFESYQQGLLAVRPVKKVLIVLVTSSRGLCGSFNSQLAKKIRDELAAPEKLAINRIGHKKIEPGVDVKDLIVDFVTVGKKGEAMVRRVQKNLVAAFPELVNNLRIDNVKPLSKIVINEYLAGTYDKVVVVYTDYISAISQQTRVRQLLPISKHDIEKQISEIDTAAKDHSMPVSKIEYKVEPNPVMVLEQVLPKLIEMQLFHAILESAAAEHSARMLAMRNATDAAAEMSGDLTFMYNQIRQMKITQEIAEISAGRAALEE
ncbi:MAG: ATP synthase F1 subunit gamma [Candidatus Falkowbacteria bacterium]